MYVLGGSRDSNTYHNDVWYIESEPVEVDFEKSSNNEKIAGSIWILSHITVFGVVFVTYLNN